MDTKNTTALNKAVEKSDVESVSKLLAENVDPNSLVQSKAMLFCSPMTQNHIEIFKLLVQHGLTVNQKLMREMFDEPGCNDCTKELVTYIINHYKKDSKIYHIIFDGLATSKHENIDMLEFLIEQGLPINDLYGYENLVFEDAVAPLHHCIPEAKYEFMSVLIKRGANIEKETQRCHTTPFFYAVEYADADAVEVLLENGAKHTDLSWATEETALQKACEKNDYDIVRVLLDYGADPNVTDKYENGALKEAAPNSKEVLLRELAKVKFEGREINKDNLKYLKKNKNSMKYLENCVKELRVLKDCIVYNELSLYDVLQMQKDVKKLTSLMKNDDFVKALKTSKKRVSKSIKRYERDLDDLIEKASEEKGST